MVPRSAAADIGLSDNQGPIAQFVSHSRSCFKRQGPLQVIRTSSGPSLTRPHGPSPTPTSCVFDLFILLGLVEQLANSWDKALATGDESIAIENLRKYFEQHFHDHNDSCVN